MFSAADIIEALGLRRRLKSIRPEIPGQMPPGWQAWLDGMSASPRGVIGAQPQDVIAEFVQRELAQPPPRVGMLNRWQAFATLWRQQWQAPEPEERGLRWFAMAFSALLHVVLGVLLLFLAFVQLPPPGAAAGDTVVQAEFIGEGTPDATGGGAPQGAEPIPSPAPPAPAAPAAAQQPGAPTEAPPAPAQPQPEQPVAAEPEAQPPPPAEPQPEPTPPVEVAPAPQPLEVTQVPEPDTTFVLPPPRPREVVVPERQVAVPEVRQPTERISRVERPTRPVVEVERVAPQVTRVTPTLQAPVPVQLPTTRAIQPSETPARDVSVPTVRAQVRDIPMPSRGTTPSAQPGTSTAPAQAPSGTTAGVAPPGGQQPAPGSGTAPSTQPGAGTTPGAAPGAWPSPQQGDDWGLGKRNVPGGAPGSTAPGSSKPGVFDRDGTPNVGEPPAPGRNAPGTLEAHIADLDRAGQWLKRPPYDYTPTTFDKYWRPHETLLQEWVRRGIKSITIPIPGTGKSLSCAVSLLALGGACGLTDPDANEQPAAARPPPDIPFKPHLQEDNGSIRTLPPGARTATPPGG